LGIVYGGGALLVAHHITRERDDVIGARYLKPPHRQLAVGADSVLYVGDDFPVVAPASAARCPHHQGNHDAEERESDSMGSRHSSLDLDAAWVCHIKNLNKLRR
jgi:hypothetical protein